MKQTDSFKTFLRWLRQLRIPPFFQSSLTALYKIGAFGVFSAVFIYIFQYGDKVTTAGEIVDGASRSDGLARNAP